MCSDRNFTADAILNTTLLARRYGISSFATHGPLSATVFMVLYLKCRFEKTIYLLKLRAQVLKNTFSWDLENVVENLRSFINKFECGPIVSEHSAEEKRNVVELLPIIIPTLLSAELALQKRSGTQNKEIRHILTGQKWKASHLPIESSQLKKSCILYSIGYRHDSLNALKTIPQAFRISSCICEVPTLVCEDFLDKIKFILRNLDMIVDLTTKDFIWKILSPCVSCLPTEASVTPPVLIYECLRCLCLPAHTSTYDHEIAYVDEPFLYKFLLYLNHSKLYQRDLKLIDILLMYTTVNGKLISHKAACLNILGWVFRREGCKSKALDCFIRSIRDVTLRNAAYWHLLFLIIEPPRGKTNNVVSEQVRHKPACTSTEKS